jgi:hypothetical protein
MSEEGRPVNPWKVVIGFLAVVAACGGRIDRASQPVNSASTVGAGQGGGGAGPVGGGGAGPVGAGSTGSGEGGALTGGGVGSGGSDHCGGPRVGQPDGSGGSGPSGGGGSQGCPDRMDANVRYPTASVGTCCATSPGGHAAWSEAFPGLAQINAMAGASNASVVMAGGASDPDQNCTPFATFGGDRFTTAGAFLTKLDAFGAHQWSHFYQGQGVAGGVAVDSSDGIVAGFYAGDTGLDVDGSRLTPGGSLAAFDPSGKLSWQRHLGANLIEAVAVDQQGDIVLLGTYGEEGADLGGGPLPPGRGSYVAKLDSAGRHVWSHGYPNAYGAALGLDSDGNLLVTGTFSGSLDLGAGTMDAGASPQMFLAKLDRTGAALWSRSVAGRDLLSSAVVADATGGLVLAFRYQGTVDLGNGPVGAPDAREARVARWDAAGNLSWSSKLFEVFDRISLGLDGTGNVIAAAQGQPGAAFPCGIVTTGDWLFFVTKMTASGESIWTRMFGPGAINALSVPLLTVLPDGSSTLASAANADVDFGQGILPMGPGPGYWNFLVRLTP